MGNFKLQMKLLALLALIGSTNAAACTGLTAISEFTDAKCETAPEADKATSEDDLKKAVAALNELWDTACTAVPDTTGYAKWDCGDDGSTAGLYSDDKCATACDTAAYAEADSACNKALAATFVKEEDIPSVKNDACYKAAEDKYYKLTFKPAAEEDAAATGSTSLALGVG